MPKAVIFDFDGVIVDSEPLHFEAFMRVARLDGVTISYNRYIESYIGCDDRDFWRVFLRDEADRSEDARNAELIATLCEKKGDAFEAIVADGLEPMAGAQRLIDDLLAADVPIAIASGATLRDIRMILSGLGLRERFEIIVTADNVERSKPDPATYRLAFEQVAAANPKLDLQPGDVVAIEDTAAGIASARGAGLNVVGLVSTSPRQALYQAHRLVDSLEELSLPVLREWFGG